MQATKDVARFGKRVILVRGRSVSAVDAIAAQLENLGCTVTAVSGQGEPSLTDVETGVSLGRDVSANVVLSVGGGAVLDLGKAVAAMIPATGDLMDHLEVVRRIFEECIAGRSACKIATGLNQDAISSPRGGAWNACTIHGKGRRA